MENEIVQSPQQITITSGSNLKDLILRFENGIGFDSPDNIHDNWAAIQQSKSIIKELENLARIHTEEYINNNKQFEVDGWVYRIGEETKVNCKDLKAVLETLLTHFAGDLDSVVLCLSKNGWKQSQVKALLKSVGKEEVWDQLFIREEKKKLQRKEPENLENKVDNKKLLRYDTKFIRKPIEDDGEFE